MRLEGDQGGWAEREVIEIDLGHILRISDIAVWVNAKGAWASNEPERGKRCLATHRVIQVRGCAEEGQPCFIDCGGSKSFGVTYDELLGTGWSLRRESWHTRTAAGQRAENCRV